jgi:hypothetical protein
VTLLLHVHNGYPSYEGSGTEWNVWDWDGYKFAKALKGEAFKGYATIKSVNGTWKKITAANPSPAFDLFGSWAANVIKEAAIDTAFLVPVPGSSCVAFDTDAKGRALCKAIAKYHPGMEPEEAFHWSEKMVPAHKSGPRHKAELLSKLVLWTGLPKDKPVILVDDVATLHGHMKACAQLLRDHGYEVVLAIAGAQTVHDRPSHPMFDFPAVDLDAAEPDPFAGVGI